MRIPSLRVWLALALPNLAMAQVPQYFVTPAAKPGGTIHTVLSGPAGKQFATFVDLHGGPTVFAGEELFLGLTPAFSVLAGGQLGLGGLHVAALTVPAAGITLGTPFYLQAIVLDSTARNGVFRVSNGESTVVYGTPRVMVEELHDVRTQGYTGTYDQTRRDRLFARPVQRRTHTFVPRDGAAFQQPLIGPLNADGARVQMVYRAIDVGARGEMEVLTAVRWFPRGPVTTMTHQRLVIEAGHTRVVPDFTIDSWSALPKYPNSGLDVVYSKNPKPLDPPVRIYNGAYSIRKSDVRPDGYLGYPQPSRDFVYNGIDSLLLDFKMSATPGMVSSNGQQVQLMVLTLAQPNARVYNRGSPGKVVDPHTVTSGRGDNTMAFAQFEFAKVHSQATSPWRRAPVNQPRYGKPAVASSMPAGTEIRVEYRSAQSPTGSGASPWVINPSFVSSLPYLQYRITMRANPRTGAVPSVESIVIPVQ